MSDSTISKYAIPPSERTFKLYKYLSDSIGKEDAIVALQILRSANKEYWNATEDLLYYVSQPQWRSWYREYIEHLRYEGDDQVSTSKEQLGR